MCVCVYNGWDTPFILLIKAQLTKYIVFFFFYHVAALLCPYLIEFENCRMLSDLTVRAQLSPCVVPKVFCKCKGFLTNEKCYFFIYNFCSQINVVAHLYLVVLDEEK